MRLLWILLFMAALPHTAAGESMVVAFLGTSITCGTGASSPDRAYPALLARKLELVTNEPVRVRNLCLGGSVSLQQLAELQTTVLPDPPNLLVIEAGTLDEVHGLPFARVNREALEEIFRLARAANLPTVAVYPFTQYAALPRTTVARLAARYHIPLADIPAAARREGLRLDSLAHDSVHVADAGHELMARIIAGLIPNLHPVAVPSLRNDAGPLKVLHSPGSSFEVTARVVVLVVRTAQAEINLRYRVNGGSWQQVRGQPGWLDSVPIVMDRRAQTRRIDVELQQGELSSVILQR